MKKKANIFFERVDDWFMDRPWMAMAYYDYPRGQRVMVMFPFHYVVRFVWWLNYLWNRFRHKESWIDKLAKERYNRWKERNG